MSMTIVWKHYRRGGGRTATDVQTFRVCFPLPNQFPTNTDNNNGKLCQFVVFTYSIGKRWPEAHVESQRLENWNVWVQTWDTPKRSAAASSSIPLTNEHNRSETIWLHSTAKLFICSNQTFVAIWQLTTVHANCQSIERQQSLIDRKSGWQKCKVDKVKVKWGRLTVEMVTSHITQQTLNSEWMKTNNLHQRERLANALGGSVCSEWRG